MKNLSKYLIKSDLFSNKTENEINEIMENTIYIIRDYTKNELVFKINQPTDYVGIILEGTLLVQKNLANGKTIHIIHKEKGAVFGEGSVFSKAKTYPCNIFSQTNSKILLIKKTSMIDLLSKDKIILSNFLKSFANRVLSLNLKTELLSYSSIQQKIAFSLLYTMDQYRNGDTIRLPFSKKTWSEHLNVSRPSLFRELKDMSSNNIICISGSIIKLVDISSLANLLYN